MQPRPEIIFAFTDKRKGAVAVAFKKTKQHGAFFGAPHIFLKFPFRDCVERLFDHTGFPSTQRKGGTRPKLNHFGEKLEG
jgi:hypothetical protein